MVAVGITSTQVAAWRWIESVAALVMATSGMLSAWLHLRLALQRVWPARVRILWAISAISLFASMTLAAIYGLRFYLPLMGLDIPWMRALHGTANAIGFGLASLLAWSMALKLKKI